MAYDYETFKVNIYKLTNINLDMYKERQMKRRIDSFIEKKVESNNYQEFFNKVTVDKELLNQFINYLTINVSEFYRNPAQWDMFEKSVLPNIISNSKGTIKIWSAACSTGDEPYTLAMILLKYLPANRFKIYATDLDDNVLEFAKVGIYPKRSLTGLPKQYLKDYFESNGNEYIISEDIKSLVEFKKHNLLEDRYPTDMDLIVCRNVVIYFTEEAKREVYLKFNSSLKNHGMLFIGNTEQIIKSKELGFDIFKSFFYIKM